MDAGISKGKIITFIKTFPLQRGFMDPLDKILSVIVANAIVIVSEDTEAEDLKRSVQNICCQVGRNAKSRILWSL